MPSNLKTVGSNASVQFHLMKNIFTHQFMADVFPDLLLLLLGDPGTAELLQQNVLVLPNQVGQEVLLLFSQHGLKTKVKATSKLKHQ